MCFIIPIMSFRVNLKMKKPTLCFCFTWIVFFERKVGLSPSKKFLFICFNEIPLKIMKNVFYFMLKTLFVLKIFNFCLDILVM